MIKETQERFLRRVAPMILRAHQFKTMHIEHYIVTFAAADEAHFRANRDHTTMGRVHCCFAVSANLNDDFDAGELSFPEFGLRSCKPAVGGAMVFSVSLQHVPSQVTRGCRYASLPFLCDDEAAKLREANAKFLGTDRAGSQSGVA